MIERKIEEIGADKTLLLVDDDEPFLRRLTKAMEKRGFQAVSYTHLTLPTILRV